MKQVDSPGNVQPQQQEQFSALNKPLRPLTRKQAAFVKYILEHPEESNTKAAMVAYPNVTYGTARQIAFDNMTKANIRSALGEANDLIEDTLTRVVKDWGTSTDVRERSLAVNTGQWIHDKIHGKATINVKSTSVTAAITLDLTGGKAGAPPQEILDQLES